MNIADIAKKFYDQEVEESGGHGTEYGVRAWAFVLRQLTYAEVTELTSKDITFIFSDNSGDPLWEKVQDLLNFWEEWSYGELCELTSQRCDSRTPLADSEVWEWLFNHIAFSREDYAFCLALLETKNEELCYVFFGGSSYGSLVNDPALGDLQKIVQGYDPVPLSDRLDSAHMLWETMVTAMGDDWKKVA